MIDAEIARLEARRTDLWRNQDSPKLASELALSSFDPSTGGALRRRYQTSSSVDMHRNLNQMSRRRKAEHVQRLLEEQQGTNAGSSGPTNQSAASSASAASPAEPHLVPLPPPPLLPSHFYGDSKWLDRDHAWVSAQEESLRLAGKPLPVWVDPNAPAAPAQPPAAESTSKDVNNSQVPQSNKQPASSLAPLRNAPTEASADVGSTAARDVGEPRAPGVREEVPPAQAPLRNEPTEKQSSVDSSTTSVNHPHGHNPVLTALPPVATELQGDIYQRPQGPRNVDPPIGPPDGPAIGAHRAHP
jgi:hypothetical protein